jgi:putative ABC transport system permease protein
MFSLARKNLWSHKRRLFSTMLAVVLGISFLSGTLVLGDTMRSTFESIFQQSNAGTDAVVRAASIDDDLTESRGLLDASLVGRARAIDGVAGAEGLAQGSGRLVGKDGTTVGSQGPPALAGTWSDDARFSPYRLADGRAPQTDDEVVINRGAARDGNLRIGDIVTLLTPEPTQVHLVGISTFGDADSSSGVTYTAFTLAGAQEHILHQPGKLSEVRVAARDGVSQNDLVSRLAPIVAPGAEAVTGTQLTAEQQQAINGQFLDFFTAALNIFAGVALLVAAFSIYNTFTIILAQRARESALLRAIGATRSQVLRSMMVEAVAMGITASIIGVIGGLGFATLLRSGFAALGSDLPATGLAVKPATVIIGLTVGTLVTIGAAMIPARRASKIAPVAALRDSAVEPAAAGIRRVVGGLAFTIAGIGLTVTGVVASTFAATALGALLTLVGVVVLGPVVAGPGGRILGWPLRLRGVTGELASENARRNPRRTSATAAALMVGVTVVTLFTVFASSLNASVTKSVEQSFGGDLVVTAGMGGGQTGFSPKLAADIATRPEVASVVGLGAGAARVGAKATELAVADPQALSQVLDLGAVDGSMSSLSSTQLAVSKTLADEKGWKVGTALPVGFVDGVTTPFTVGAIYDTNDVIGDVVMTRDAWTPHARQGHDVADLVKLRDGVSLTDGKTAVKAVAAPYVGTKVEDRQEYLDAVASSITRTLSLIYVMLALAVLIALMGIANTLALSVLERRRELGLLRAVGETRRQVRSMIRGESMIISVFGTIGGIGLGVFFGWALVRAAAAQGLGVFAAGPSQLVVILIVGAVAGVLAAMRPARKASKLDVLAAIATD